MSTNIITPKNISRVTKTYLLYGSYDRPLLRNRKYIVIDEKDNLVLRSSDFVEFIYLERPHVKMPFPLEDRPLIAEFEASCTQEIYDYLDTVKTIFPEEMI